MKRIKSIQIPDKKLLFISSVFFLLTSIFSVGYYQSDEHFQILEYAGLKLHMTQSKNLPWEYHYQMRPALQPAIAVIFHKGFNCISIDNPYITAFSLRFISALLSFLCLWLLFNAFKHEIKSIQLKKWFLLLLFFLWFIVYNSVRFSSENWSGTIFVIGFAYYLIKEKSGQANYILTGTLLGLSFILRPQTGFLVFGFVLWLLFINKTKVNKVLLLFCGISISIAIGVFIDRWFYNKWVITFWNYLEQNIIYGKLSEFGSEPWWYYFKKTFNFAGPPFSLVYILCILVYIIFKRKEPLTWILLPFLIIHFVLSRKDIRFMFPIIKFLPVLIILSIEIINEKLNKNVLNNYVSKIFVICFWIANLVLLTIISFKPADNYISLYKKIYKTGPNPAYLYYDTVNPYKRALDIHFYKRKNLVIKDKKLMDEIEHNKSNTFYLFTTQNPDFKKKEGFKYKQIYCSQPSWIKRFNFFGWTDRIKAWYLYKIVPNK